MIMRRGVIFITGTLCLFLLFLAVSGMKAEAAPMGEFEARWKDLVAKAQKEGTVSIYCSAVPVAARSLVQQAFKKKFGINVEYTPASGGEIVQKYSTELTAGMHLVDVMHTGNTQFSNLVGPMNVTVPMEPLFMLPEVTDNAKWRGGKLPWVDAEKHALMVILLANCFYIVNTDMIKEDSIKSTLDVLNPKWKGKIILQDPGIPGNGNDWFSFTLLNILGMDRGEKFMRDLVKQDPTVVRDSRQITEGVARGKYQVGIGCSVAQVVEFIKSGAHLAFAKINEPRQLSPGAGVIYTFKEVPHPNARKLFINWFLSREGNALYAPAHGYPPLRADVSTDDFIPALIPGPKDILPSEEYTLKKGDLMKLSGAIFSGLRN